MAATERQAWRAIKALASSWPRFGISSTARAGIPACLRSRAIRFAETVFPWRDSSGKGVKTMTSSSNLPLLHSAFSLVQGRSAFSLTRRPADPPARQSFQGVLLQHSQCLLASSPESFRKSKSGETSIGSHRRSTLSRKEPIQLFPNQSPGGTSESRLASCGFLPS